MNKEELNISTEGICCPLGVLSILSRKLAKVFRNHFSKLNVSNSQVGIFLILHNKGELSQSEIGKYMELERSTVSRDLVRLVDNGFLYKSKDGVSPKVGLTKKGKELAEKISIEWQKGYTDAKELLGDKGMEALKELNGIAIKK